LPGLLETAGRANLWVFERRLRLEAARKLARLTVRSLRVHGASPAWVARRLVELRRRDYLGWPYLVDEIGLLGLLDPKVPEQRLLDCVSMARLRPLQLRLSPPPLSRVIDDKALFYTVCSLAGLPVPETHAFVYRREAGWTRDGRTPLGRAQWAGAFDRLIEGEVVAKPALGDMGDGVRGFRREGDRFFEGERAIGDAGELYDSLFADRRYGGFVIQERVRNHEAIAALSGSRTVQTTRVVTLIERPGEEAAILFATLKVAGGIVDTVVDNIHSGAHGNGVAPIDVATGRVGTLLLPLPNGRGSLDVDTHPRTGRAIRGFELPLWEETLDLARRAAACLGMLRTIGWDIAITPDGPVLLEGNSGWGAPSSLMPVPPIEQRLRDAVRREDEVPEPAAELEESLLLGVRDASARG